MFSALVTADYQSHLMYRLPLYLQQYSVWGLMIINVDQDELKSQSAHSCPSLITDNHENIDPQDRV